MLLSLSADPTRADLSVQTQSQQMNEAMVLKTMRGTQWRVIEERYSDSYFGKGFNCKSLATFNGFVGDTNKGTVTVEYTCGSEDDGKAATRSGRWVTKPSRLAKGSVQLSPRWKVKLPEDSGGGTIIYKGFINAEKMIGRAGKSVSAEMVGVILTGEQVNHERVIGRFTADFVRQLTEEEVDAIKIGGAVVNKNSDTKNSPITLSPK